MAQPFHADRGELSGEATPVTSPVSSGPQFYPAASGALLVRRTTAASTQLSWVDRAGKPLGKLAEPGSYYSPKISPDGKAVAVSKMESNNIDVWLHDLQLCTPYSTTAS